MELQPWLKVQRGWSASGPSTCYHITFPSSKGELPCTCLEQRPSAFFFWLPTKMRCFLHLSHLSRAPECPPWGLILLVFPPRSPGLCFRECKSSAHGPKSLPAKTWAQLSPGTVRTRWHDWNMGSLKTKPICIQMHQRVIQYQSWFSTLAEVPHALIRVCCLFSKKWDILRFSPK